MGEKILLQKNFGYKKYIENHPDDWWELYTQGYIEPKFIPKAEKMYVCYVYFAESPQVKKMDEFYKQKPERNNKSQFQQWLGEVNKTREEGRKILKYFTNNFYEDLKSDITVLTNYFFNDESKFKSEDFIIKDGKLKFLSNGNEYDLNKFGTFLLYDGNGDPNVYNSRVTKSIYFTYLLSNDDNKMLAEVIESMDQKLECNNEKEDLKTYSLNAKIFFNDLFTSMNKFLKLKFENFDDKDEKKNFVNRRIDSIEEIINKANNRIEKAWKVYQKHKEKIKSLEGDRKNSNEKIDFLTYYILLDDNELKQKYKFLKDEDLKIEPEPVENIIEMNNINNNNNN